MIYGRSGTRAVALGLVLALGTGCHDTGSTVDDSNQELVGAGQRDYTKTQYPIVLCHGLLGFRDLFGLVDYWYGIPGALSDGGAKVFVTETIPLESSEARGEALIPQIEEILALTGAPKVNLVGHSQGALDVRYIAAVRPDLVASVTSVGGPHLGADLADVVETNTFGTLDDKLIASLGKIITLAAGSHFQLNEQAAIHQLTTSYITGTFNRRYPAGVPLARCGQGASIANGIRYFSWSGTAIHTNTLDVLDVGFAVTSLFYPGHEDDGLVGRCSSHLGMVIRDDYAMNHLDEVNHILGLVDVWHVRPEAVFRMHANRLKNAGL